ncbi:MAG: AMP-binding protein, partial [Clostridia bacterium]|nr:AMP-binding protein [Clostridia bacterium]
MNLTFSTKNVNRVSFLEMCRFAYDYGYSGFEIYDAKSERRAHADSILRNENLSDAKRKLNNRNLKVSALTYPYSLDSNEANSNDLCTYIDMARAAGVETVIVSILNKPDMQALSDVLMPAIIKAEAADIEILFETTGYLADTKNIIDIINYFANGVLGAAWNIRQTFFKAGESAETTIKTLGAYIRYVRIGDMKGDVNVLIGEGELPVSEFVDALNSLNYEGFVCADWNDEINDADIVLTHFINFMAGVENKPGESLPQYYNRSHTGTYPWKQYDVVDKTFSQVLDCMAERYPDQYAFKYTTLDYTRTYAQFRRDVDEVAASLISLGVKPGHHVAIWATNVPAWFLTFWATTKIGAVLVTV